MIVDYFYQHSQLIKIIMNKDEFILRTKV